MKHASEFHGGPSSRELEYLAGWQRERAQLRNLRERLTQERQQTQQRLRAEMLEPLLTLADHFQSLAKHAPEEFSGNIWVQGVLHIAREFERTLSEAGLEVIAPQNELFNPILHEAVAHEEGEKDTVLEVVQVGYKLGDKVLRPAKVKVAK